MISLSVLPVDGETELLGKKANELQTGIEIGDDTITGTLHHVTGYTGFSSLPAEQTGNYIGLLFDPTPEDATVTVEIVGGTKGPVQLDADMMYVGKIANKDTQSIKVVVTKDDETVEKTYSLSGLTLESE